MTTEGIETDAQKALLVGTGCRRMQRYLLSPPLEPGQLLALRGLSPADQERSAVRA